MPLPRFALRSICIAFTLGAMAGSAAQAQSLMELYETAREYDAPYRSAKAQFDANLAKMEQSKAGLLPTIGANASVSRSRLQATPDGVPTYDRNYGSRGAGLSLTQPLYRPANVAAYEQGLKLLDLSQAQLALAEQDLMVRVSQAYFDVLASQDNLAFIRAQKAAVTEQLAAARRNFEVGTATITDTREAEARNDLVVSQEIAAENDLKVKKLFLDQLVGRAGTAPHALDAKRPLPALPANPVDEWVDSSATHPNVVVAKAALDIAELETRKAEAAHKPTVDLTGNYGYSRNINGTSISGTSTLGSRVYSGSVGVTLNVPIFAGFALQNRVKETLALEEKARADLDTAKRSVAQATRAAYFGVVSGTGQVKALEAAELSSQSALDANKLGYQVGVRINIDVLNAQSQLFQTKRDLAQARYNVLLGGLKLRQANGSLNQDDLRTVNALLANP